MPNPSPLRYPGGKNRLAGFIRIAIQNLEIQDCTYVEPFAGGAGVALTLLLDGTVNRIVINDYDKTIDFKTWYAQTESILGDQTILFHFWCSEHRQEVEAFVENFIDVFNRFAEKNDVDAIPQPQEENEGTNT